MRNKNQKLIFSLLVGGLALMPYSAYAQQFSLQAGNVTGYVYYDNNNNGEEDQGDTPAADIRVIVKGSQENVLTTDEAGEFLTTENAGQVTVMIDLTEGAGKGKTITTSGGAEQTVTVVGGSTININPVGLKGSGVATKPAADPKPVTTTKAKELKKTNAKVYVPLTFGLLALIALTASQYAKRRVQAGNIKINLLQ